MAIINPKEFNENVFSLIGDKWCLISAYDEKHEGLPYNAMTASWGGMGVLWNKNVFFCFIRPQRYTKEFTDSSDKIALSFFDESIKSALSYCGTHSGRDSDKLAECGLNVKVEDGACKFEEAVITIVGKKLFAAEMKDADFIDKSLIDKNYKQGDFHTVYVCEIESIETK